MQVNKKNDLELESWDLMSLENFFTEVATTDISSQRQLNKIWRTHFQSKSQIPRKEILVSLFRRLLDVKPDLISLDDIQSKIQLKPVRTGSGVTPVTVLTKPFPCPGKCIFCPNDIRMPKSYLSDEPGAQRAERNSFDPYLQTFSRIKALDQIGHDISKIEIIVLGGTWSFYPENYQIWFIKRCFQALNDYSEQNHDEYNQLLAHKSSPNHRDLDKNQEVIRNVDVHIGEKTYNQIISQQIAQKQEHTSEKATWQELENEQTQNETATSRCVGLVIETRPDKIDPEEVIRIRRLGCTKTQIGFQSLNDEVLDKNHRGHDVAATREAVKLLRWAGFKIHAHWMANLYGSNPRADMEDYAKLFSDKDFRPDELKIYPCSLIETAELMDYYKKGLWKPYSFEELFSVIKFVLTNTVEYCRLTRIIRDIPGGDIVVGNKITNFRQIAELELEKAHEQSHDIRAREVKNLIVSLQDLSLKVDTYLSSIGTEMFLQYVTKDNKIAGFLRLCLPNIQLQEGQYFFDNLPDLTSYKVTSFNHPFISELDNCAIIREVHVYGKAASFGTRSNEKTQHLGLGTKLIEAAEAISKKLEYKKIAVISAIGTREYYKKKGFELEKLYQVKKIV